MKKYVAFLSLFILGCSSSDISPDNTPNLRPLSAAETQISASANDFTFKLLRGVQKKPLENTFISALSVSNALAMTLNGADNDTKQSIINTIDFKNLSATDVNQAYKDLSALLLNMDKKNRNWNLQFSMV